MTPHAIHLCELSIPETDANILLHSDAYIYNSGSVFGAGSGPILLGSLHCDGSEGTLLECSNSFLSYYTYCSHNQDAGIRCEYRLYSGKICGTCYPNRNDILGFCPANDAMINMVW